MAFFETLEQKVSAKLVAALGLGLGVLSMGACASAEAQPGPATVIGHDYTGPYTTYVQVGKVPVIQYHPADYDLLLRQCGREGDEFADAQGCVEFEVDVNEETYNKYPDGSEVIIPLE